VSDEPDVPAGGGDQRALVARLRAVIEAKDAENALLRAELEAQLGRYRRLELRVAELERRVGSDSTNSGIPPSKDPIGAWERRKAERERRRDRKRGGQPGHPGAGLSRDPGPDERTEVPPPAECSQCGTGMDGAQRAGTWWSQVWDVKITRFVTRVPAAAADLPVLREGECRAGTWAVLPGQRVYGPGVNTAAVLLSSYGNVPSERAANLIGMLLGVPVSAGFVDLASERLSARLEDAGFDAAMQAALGKEPVLAADDAPIFVKPLLDRDLQTHDGSRTIASMRRTPGRALGGRTGLRTIRSAHHDVERRPRWAQSQSAEECASCSLPIRELVARIPAPCGDHGKN